MKKYMLRYCKFFYLLKRRSIQILPIVNNMGIRHKIKESIKKNLSIQTFSSIKQCLEELDLIILMISHHILGQNIHYW